MNFCEVTTTRVINKRQREMEIELKTSEKVHKSRPWMSPLTLCLGSAADDAYKRSQSKKQQ